MTAKFLVDRIMSSYRQGVPNGYAIGWGEDRFEAALKKSLPEYTISNLTSFDYAACNTYEIQVLDEPRSYRATLKISFIADCYVLHLGYLHRISASNAQSHFHPSAKAIHSFLKTNGFDEPTDEQLKQPVPEVALALSANATVGKCLFDDFNQPFSIWITSRRGYPIGLMAALRINTAEWFCHLEDGSRFL